VTDDELMAIGRFARLSGLSIHTLRHYDDVDLLTPADVDANSGYRRYRKRQVPQARLIAALRWIDLPIDEIRQILNDATAADQILDRHRQRLTRQLELLVARLGDVDRFTRKGLTMPEVQTGSRPVQLKIAVNNSREAVEFYRNAFGLRYEVTRRTDDEDYSSFVFGTYGQSDFFLLHVNDDPTDADRPGPSTFGLLVDDLDAVHARAMAAGGTEVVAPRSPQGMPRSSAIRDPSGNWIWLYQG
jgi:DNA-binding transcriptional MerR regulator